MAETIRDFLVKLGVKTDDKGLQKFTKGMETAKTMVAGLSLAVVGGASLLGKFISDVAAVGDAAAKTSQQLGLTAEALQEVQYAGDQSGVTADETAQGFLRLVRGMNQAKSGAGAANDAFKKLGVRVTDTNGDLRNSDAVFSDIAEKLSKMPDGAEKTATAFDIFGRAGAKMIPLINSGAKGLAELRQEARDLGGVLSNEDAKASEEFLDSIARLKVILSGFRNKLALAIIPTLTNAANRVRDWYMANRELIRQKLDYWLEKLRQGIKKVGDWILWAYGKVEQFGGFEKIISGVIVALKYMAGMKVLGMVFSVLSGIVGAFTAIGGSAGLGTIAAVVGALLQWVAIIGAVYLILQDVWVFLQGGESLTGDFFAAFGQGDGILDAVANTLRSFIDMFMSWLDIAIPYFQGLWGIITAVAIPAFEALKSVMTILWHKIWRPQIMGAISLLKTFIDYLGKGFKLAGELVSKAKDLPFVGGALSAMGDSDGLQKKISGFFEPLNQLAANSAGVGSNVSVGGSSATINLTVPPGTDTAGVAAIITETQKKDDEARRRRLKEIFGGGEG